MSSARWVMTFVIGLVLVGIGLFIALRPLWTHNATLMGPRWFDLLVAAVSMLRGVMNMKLGLYRRTLARR